MVITVTSFLGANHLFAYNEPTTPPPCMGDECPSAQWSYNTMTFNPGWMDGNIGSNCVVTVNFKYASGCGKCFVSIISYKYQGDCIGPNVSQSKLMNAVLALILLNLPDIKCLSTPTQPCVDNIRVSTGACTKIYHYYDTPGHDPNGNTVAYVPVISEWGFLGPNIPTYVPILLGETVYVPCTPICCKSTYTICWTYQDGKGVAVQMIPNPDVQSTPDCIDLPNTAYDGHPCYPNCWFNPWNFQMPTNLNKNPDYK